MIFLKRILFIFNNYETIQRVKWVKNGIFAYILFVISIIKFIINNPLYKVFKYIFHILVIFEGFLLVIFFMDPFVLLDLSNLHYNICEFFFNLYTQILKYIRDKIDYLLSEQIIEPTNNGISNEVSGTETKEDVTNYKLWLTITIVIIISGIVIYYYNPDILDYFKYNDKGDNNELNLLESPNTESPTSPTESDYFKDLSEMENTPKASSSDLPKS